MGSGSTNKSRKKHEEGSWALWKTAPGDITFGDLKKFVDLLHSVYEGHGYCLSMAPVRTNCWLVSCLVIVGK